jgi:hypothetical protein
LKAPAASARGVRRREESLSCAIADGAPISASTIASSGLPSGGGDAGFGPRLLGACAEPVQRFPSVKTMKLPQPSPQLTAAEFNAALKEAGFGVEHARIIDVSRRCPGFVTTPAFRGRGVIDRAKTLAKVIRERDAEIARRAAVSDP